MPTTRIEIPVLPVSFNQTRYAHWRAVQRKAQPLKDALIYGLRGSGLPKPLSRVEVTAEMRFKDRRRRDEGNFRTPLEKTLGDVLQTEGYLEDDGPDQYRFGAATFSADRGTPLTILTLNWTQ